MNNTTAAQNMTWEGDDEGASNDLGDYVNDHQFNHGFPSVFSCEKHVGCDANSLNIAFDYEAHSLTTANLTTALWELEWIMLYEVAKGLGLEKCDKEIFSGNCTASGRSLRLGRDTRVLQTDDVLVVGVFSEPDDEVDLVYTNCIIEVPETPGLSTVCTPIKGYMDARYIGDDERVALQNVLYAIRDGIETDTIKTTEIINVSFIGTRVDDGSPPLSNAENDEITRDTDGDDSFSRLGIGLIVSLSVLFICIVVTILMLRKRRRTREGGDEEAMEEELQVPPVGEGNSLDETSATDPALSIATLSPSSSKQRGSVDEMETIKEGEKEDESIPGLEHNVTQASTTSGASSEEADSSDTENDEKPKAENVPIEL